MASPFEGCYREAEGDAPFGLLGLVVEGRGPLFDGSLTGGCPADVEQRLGEGRLAAATVTNQHDVSNLLWNHTTSSETGIRS